MVNKTFIGCLAILVAITILLIYRLPGDESGLFSKDSGVNEEIKCKYIPDPSNPGKYYFKDCYEKCGCRTISEVTIEVPAENLSEALTEAIKNVTSQLNNRTEK